MSIKQRVCLIGAVFFAVLIPLAVFAYAADTSYNIVDEDIVTWDRFAAIGNSNSIQASALGANANWAQVGFTHTAPYFNQYAAIGYLYSIPSGFLVSGQSYTFSFFVPSDADIHAAYSSFTTALLDQRYDKLGGLVIGVGFRDSDGFVTPLSDSTVVVLTSENRQQYAGKVNYVSFVMPDSNQGQLCFYVGGSFVSSSSSESVYLIIGRRYTLIDNARKAEIEQYNRVWYGNAEGNYTNIYTTESYDVGSASDTDSIDSGLDQWEDGLGEFGTPLRVSGVFLNSLFSTGGIVTIGVIVLVILMFGVIFRIFGVT